MANSLKSLISSPAQAPISPPPGWLKLGIVAAASVLAGGVAAAWWYRKTLIQLRQTEEKPGNSHFGISGDDSEDEV
jgi:hypothetical protein